jgi:ectoine hydroxylase
MLALDPDTRDNGCLRVVKDSNQLGRLEHQPSGSQLIANPQRVEMALAEMQEIHCEMQPGSALYFHGNILHGSDPNLSEQPRWALIFAYVAAKNTVVLPEVEKDLSPPLAGWSDDEVAAATARHWDEIQAQRT